MKTFLHTLLVTLVAAAGIQHASAVLTLDFADGNGTTSVDQYTGVAGSGWNTAWTTASGGSVTSVTNTVTNLTPLYTGGDNYLSASYSVAGGGGTGTQWMRVSRQLNPTGINLGAALTYSFTLRPETPIGGSGEFFTIFSGTSATTGTSGSDTWKITADGAGWKAFTTSSNTSVTLGLLGVSNSAQMSGRDYNFTIFSDPTTKSWSVTILDLGSGTSTSSGLLAWRSLGATENQFLNFVSSSNAGIASTIGYSLDNLSVMAVPEPNALGAVALGWILIVSVRKIRRRYSPNA